MNTPTPGPWLSGQAAFSDMPDDQLRSIMANPGEATRSNADSALAELERRVRAKAEGRP